jgi:hypothetical protein
MQNGSLNIPLDSCLPGTNIEAPFVVVGDEDFPLKTYLMRPYPGRQSGGNDFMTYFNNRLSRARRASENAFGILAQKFRILFKDHLPPNDIYICRTAQLTSRRCILNIYSTNVRTEYFKHAA